MDQSPEAKFGVLDVTNCAQIGHRLHSSAVRFYLIARASNITISIFELETLN
jgi:hypothetical protein